MTSKNFIIVGENTDQKAIIWNNYRPMDQQEPIWEIWTKSEK